jgi:hypothetical protein
MSQLDSATRVAAQFVDHVVGVERFGEGLINETFLVRSSTYDIVLQRLNLEVFADPDAVMANVTRVSAFVGDTLLPRPVRTIEGDWLAREAGDVWRAWKRIPDARTELVSSPVIARAAGALLGRFHSSVADLDPESIVETIPYFHDLRRRFDALQRAVAADSAGRADAARELIDMAVSREPLVELASETLARVPRRVAHNDAALTNMLFVQDDAACLVDLDTLMPTAWFWDVGDLVRTAATAQAEDDPSAGVDRDLYAAIHEGYRSTAPQMTRAEIEALDVAGPIVTYEQALRFLTDWLEGDAYYRVVRPDQNLDRAHAQLGLVASLLDTVGDR